MPEDIMLTTVDNPYDPFTHFDEWMAYDMAKGYNTCSYLDRIVVTRLDFEEHEQLEAINNAIYEICRVNPLGIHTIARRKENKKT